MSDTNMSNTNISSIDLVSIYSLNRDQTYSALYQLLGEREAYESISHNAMPSYKQHAEFINRRPYKAWYCVMQGGGNIVGSTYITFSNEVGIAIFKKYRNNGYATAALKKLIDMHSDEKFFLANINPANAKSIDLFTTKLGFSIIQHTYKLETDKMPGEQ